MSPERAYTVEPVISTDEAGEETIQDFAVIGDHSETIAAFNRGELNDWTPDSEGRYHYNYQDVEEESEYDPSSFNESEYIEAIYESNPQLEDAISWGIDNLSQDQLAAYNQAVENGNLDELHDAVSWLLRQYEENGDYEETIIDEEEDEEPKGESLLTDDASERIDELSDDDADELANTMDALIDMEPGGENTAYEWEQLAVDADDAGDVCTSYVAALTAQYHAGNISAEEAIADAINSFDIQQLKQVYRQLSNQ